MPPRLPGLALGLQAQYRNCCTGLYLQRTQGRGSADQVLSAVKDDYSRLQAHRLQQAQGRGICRQQAHSSTCSMQHAGWKSNPQQSSVLLLKGHSKGVGLYSVSRAERKLHPAACLLGCSHHLLGPLLLLGCGLLKVQAICCHKEHWPCWHSAQMASKLPVLCAHKEVPSIVFACTTAVCVTLICTRDALHQSHGGAACRCLRLVGHQIGNAPM